MKQHKWRLDSSGEIDRFAFEEHFCNGPYCEDCSKSFCEHCFPDDYDTECFE